MESLLNLSPLYTFVSKNAISESDISAVNFSIVVVVCPCNIFLDIVFVCVPQTEDIVNISLPN